jgi:hypothetical protein
MSSIKENNELRNRNQQRSNSGSTPATATSATQAFKRKQVIITIIAIIQEKK